MTCRSRRQALLRVAAIGTIPLVAPSLFSRLLAGPEEDDELKTFCEKKEIPLYQPQAVEEDVIDRYVKTAAHYEADSIVRVTADCPFMTKDMIEKLSKKLT